jgi:hypothetical protein
MNVENKLAKALGKDDNLFVIKAADRDQVLNEISARMARYEKLDPDLYSELKRLRMDVKEVFNKGLTPSDEIIEQLYFLDPKTRDVIEKISRNQLKTITPDDFSQVSLIMSEHLSEQVPILKEFTKFFGRLAETYLTTAKPSNSALDTAAIIKRAVLGARREKKLPKPLVRILGIKNESIRTKMLNRYKLWDEESLFDEILYGAKAPTTRRTGFKVGDYSIFSEDIVKGSEVLYPNKLPKSWTNVPFVNFDGKVLEQNFTQTFEERLLYKEGDKWINNIVQVKQKTDPTWWEEFRNKSGKMNDIADVQKARTAYGVNANHSKYCCV